MTANLDCGIYEIVGPSGRYIGSAKSFIKRWRHHKWLLRRNEHHCRHLQFAFNFHGESAFTFRKLVITAKEDLLMFEQRFLDAAPAGTLYNSMKHVLGVCGFIVSDDTRRKISAANTGKVRSDEFKARVSAWAKAQRPSDETRKKLSAHQLGKQKAKPNASGHYGVYRMGARWQAKVGVGGEQKYLGNFDTIAEAAAAVQTFMNRA